MTPTVLSLGSAVVLAALFVGVGVLAYLALLLVGGWLAAALYLAAAAGMAAGMWSRGHGVRL